MHVVFLELLIDPICAMVEAEPSDAEAMRRPPRRKSEALFGPVQIGLALLQGGGVLVGVLTVYLWSLGHYLETEARGAAFLTLVLGNLVLALADASSAGGRLFASHRRIYWTIAAAACGALALLLEAPPIAALFQVAPPRAELLLVSLTVAGVAGGWYGLARSLGGRLRR